MKLFIASLGTETNTFAPMPTGLCGFEDTMVFRRDATRHTPQLFTEALHVWRRMAEERDWAVFESLAVFAQPAGPTVRTVYENLRDEILADLRSCDDVDAVLIQMHGAMVADGYDDCEGDFLQRAREVAPGAVIGLELDPHCHLTQDMMDASDVIIAFKEYPHTDASARATELFQIVTDTVAGKVTPVMRDFDCKMISMYMTAHGPMRDFVDAMMAAEGHSRVLSLSLIHGFPWGDVDRVGTRMLAITDGDHDLAKETSKSFGQRIIAMRHDICPPRPTIKEALDRAIAIEQAPIVLADMADNAGGGAPSDSTFLLREVMERGLTNVVTGIYWDPILTRICAEAGEGAALDIRLGGKIGPMSGAPIDLSVTIRKIASGMTQRMGESRMPLGMMVWVEGSGIDIVINDLRTQCFHPEAFEQIGISLCERKLVCVKSTYHFYAGFAPIAAEVINVATPGAITPDFANIPYKKRSLDYWPHIATPWG